MKFKQKIVNLLRWSKKYTQTDMIYLAKGGFWLSLGQVISFISAFLLAIAFANLLPKETYGNYKYVLSITSVLGVFALPGINTAILRAVAQGNEGSFVPALKTRLRWATISGLASLALAGYYFLNKNTTISICFLIAAAFLPLMYSFTSYHALWRGRKRFDIQTKYSIIVKVLTTASLILSLFLFKNIFLIILVYFASHTILNFIFLRITIKKLHPSPQDPEAISYGKHLSIIAAAERISSKLNSILLWNFLGTVPLAIFSFASAPPQYLKSLISGTSLLALPKLSQKSKQEIKASLLNKVFKFSIVIIPVVIIYILLAPYLYKIFLPQYLESVIYSQIFILNLLFFPKILLDSALIAQAQKKKLYFLKTSSLILNIILLITLLPLYGIWGVIAAGLGIQMYRTIALIWLFKTM